MNEQPIGWTTWLVVPSEGLLGGGRMRIQKIEMLSKQGLSDYRRHVQDSHDHWEEAGHVDTSGRLILFDGPDDVAQELRECEPIMGGLVVHRPIWEEQT